jgi:hypothetical protein
MRPTPGTLLGKKHKMHHREMRLEVGRVGSQVDMLAGGDLRVMVDIERPPS